MEAIRSFTRKAIDRVGERGSALLVGLMITVGLSLLGLAFVAVSETESAIAQNQRNYTQVEQVAEAACNRAVDWFQNPDWAAKQGIMPPNNNAIKVARRLYNGGPSVVYTRRYKEDSSLLLFDKPFRPPEGTQDDRFYGTENNPDVLINNTTAATICPVNATYPTANFLKNFNIKLFNTDATATSIDNSENIEVTDIRVYAPPTDGGTVNSEAGWTAAASGFSSNQSGFVEGGARFGVATIRATAVKYKLPGGAGVAGQQVLATRTVRMTVSEYPFPGPQGPIQSNANIDTNGNYQVHWGKITAEGTATLKRPYVGINWFDAYNRVHTEHGYDSNLTAPYFTSQGARATDIVYGFDGTSANFKHKYPWLYELIGRSYEDPWYEARSRGQLDQATVGAPHPYKYQNPALDPSGPQCNPCNSAAKASTPGQSNFFSLQDHNEAVEPGDYREVLFPRIDYNFWKNLAVSADDQPNIYYLQWVSGDTFRDRQGNVRSFRDWVDVTQSPPAGTGPKSVPGFYFFETQNGLNPQNGGGGVLTPQVSLNGGSMQMQGFIYLNADLRITGLKGYDYYYNMPGEVFRDVGYQPVEDKVGMKGYKSWRRDAPATQTLECVPLTGANCAAKEGAGNGRWDYQDLPWSRGASAINGVFDYVVVQHDGKGSPARPPKPTRLSGALADADAWFIVPYFGAENVGCNPGVNCSEPHEPYLNFRYPTTATADTVVGWNDPTSNAARRPKVATGAIPPNQAGYSIGTPVTCVAESTVAIPNDGLNGANTNLYKTDRENCTSNGYDRDGGLVLLSPLLDGVLYMEGQFPSAGNGQFFGSILIQGNVGATGTPDVFFDEKLVKGDWPPGRFGFPRVYISSVQTDQ